MTALLAACVAFQLNASMLSPALVGIARELDTDDATVDLSQTMFFTTAALFSVFLPRLSDIVGRKRVLTAMLAVMLVGTVVAALATNIEMLFVGRIIQGVSGPVVPITLLMLRSEIADPKRYGAMMGLVTAVNGGIAGVDAFVGGWLVTNHGFRSVFWMMAAVTAVAALFVLWWAPDSRPSKGTRMDWWGVLPLVVSIAALLTAFNEAGNLSAANGLVVAGCVIISLVAFRIFWAVENRVAEPLVTTAVLRRRSTWALSITTLLTLTGVFAVVNGLVVSLAQNADAGFDMEADVASLAFLTPYAIVGWIVGPFAGRLAPTLGYLKVLRTGLVGSVAATVIMALVGVHSMPVLIAATVLIGITYAGIGNIMLNGLGIVLSPKENPGFLPGLNAASFNLGAGLSFVILPAFQVIGSPAGSSSTSGYAIGLLIGAGITAAALAVSFLIPKPVTAEVGTAPEDGLDGADTNPIFTAG
uniref:uridine transporter UriT n=1 Tax=Rhodococcus marinonascens TaxID=38311 RepID=UPI0009354DA0